MFRARQQRCHSNGQKVAADDSTLDYPSKTLIHSFLFSTEKFPAFRFFLGAAFSSIFSFVRINGGGCNCCNSLSVSNHRLGVIGAIDDTFSSTTFITNVLAKARIAQKYKKHTHVYQNVHNL